MSTTTFTIPTGRKSVCNYGFPVAPDDTTAYTIEKIVIYTDTTFDGFISVRIHDQEEKNNFTAADFAASASSYASEYTHTFTTLTNQVNDSAASGIVPIDGDPPTNRQMTKGILCMGTFQDIEIQIETYWNTVVQV